MLLLLLQAHGAFLLQQLVLTTSKKSAAAGKWCGSALQICCGLLSASQEIGTLQTHIRVLKTVEGKLQGGHEDQCNRTTNSSLGEECTETIRSHFCRIAFSSLIFLLCLSGPRASSSFAISPASPKVLLFFFYASPIFSLTDD